ncbi:hypothetical protein ACHHYP_04379 [Achlya hypogyna]|uniref:Uncharacterized protein n=1 Tax=Achlya hypogyna TaxID=1202772 RepID=A0A1V9Z1U3_ACHHY|nr:hypothetical protein ACHHYP_04379 [Achlya hypogyna]
MDECHSPEHKRQCLEQSATEIDPGYESDRTVMGSAPSSPDEAESPCFFGDDVASLYMQPKRSQQPPIAPSLITTESWEAATVVATPAATPVAPEETFSAHECSLNVMLAQASPDDTRNESLFTAAPARELSPASQVCVLSHIGALAMRQQVPEPTLLPKLPEASVVVSLTTPHRSEHRRSHNTYSKKILVAAIDWDSCSEEAFVQGLSDPEDNWAFDALSDSDFD